MTHHNSRNNSAAAPTAPISARHKLAMVGSVAVLALVSVAPAALGQTNPSDTRPTPQDTRPPYVATIVQATTPNPDSGATVAPPTAAVAGIQVTVATTVATTAATTVAPTVVSVAGNVVTTAPVSVLGVTIEEQVEDVAFTGSESGRYTSVGLALTAVGATLITVSRRRRRARV